MWMKVSSAERTPMPINIGDDGQIHISMPSIEEELEMTKERWVCRYAHCELEVDMYHTDGWITMTIEVLHSLMTSDEDLHNALGKTETFCSTRCAARHLNEI